MNSLYIIDNGITLKKKSERIALKKNGKIIEEVPMLNLKRVMIFGNNQVSTELLRYLSNNGIELAFLSGKGRFQFRIVPDTSKNIYLRMAQHRCYDNPEFRKTWSIAIVSAKIRNQRNVMVRAQKNQNKPELSMIIDQLDKCLIRIKNLTSIDEIMGIEGYASSLFFKAYGSLILKNFSFNKRQYYPPPDPVNALLSFGYMLIFNELSSLLEAAGFDIFLGFLHSVKYGRASLATDIMEEFRSPIIDRLVLYLINLGVIKPDQFSTKNDGKGIEMNKKAMKAYLTNYEKFMTTDFVDYKSRQRKNFRVIFREKVLHIEKCLLSNENYQAFVFYP